MPRRLPVGGRHVRCEQTKTCVPVVKQALGQALLLLLPLPHQRLTLHTVPRGHGCGRDGKRQQRFEHGVAVGRSPCHGVCGAMRMRPNTDTVARMRWARAWRLSASFAIVGFGPTAQT